MKPEHDTSPQLSIGPKRPRSEGHTPTEQPPKKPGVPLEPGSYKDALLNFKAAILLDHPEDKLSLEDQDLNLAEIGGVFYETLTGDTHMSDPTEAYSYTCTDQCCVNWLI